MPILIVFGNKKNMRIIPPPIPPNRTEDYWPSKENQKEFIRIQKKIKKAIKRSISSSK